MPFRATKDIDLVLIVEALTAEFGETFWEFIKEAEYDHCNKSTGEAQFYRFTDPKSKEYPYMIEIFSRNPEMILLDDDARITPLPMEEEVSSLSAILLNEAYYKLLKSGKKMIDGISVLSAECLIPFKAKAWLDLTERKAKGEKVDSRNIKKHKNDVFRLAQLLEQESKHLDDEVRGDMEQFLLKMENEMIDLKSIGVSGSSKMQILNRLYRCYEIQRKDIVLIDN